MHYQVSFGSLGKLFFVVVFFKYCDCWLAVCCCACFVTFDLHGGSSYVVEDPAKGGLATECCSVCCCGCFYIFPVSSL